jgi:hypothetical protein
VVEVVIIVMFSPFIAQLTFPSAEAHSELPLSRRVPGNDEHGMKRRFIFLSSFSGYTEALLRRGLSVRDCRRHDGTEMSLGDPYEAAAD